MLSGKSFLNTIYFTLITQRAKGTYKDVLAGANVGLCGNVVQETQEPRENHHPWMGDCFAATCL